MNRTEQLREILPAITAQLTRMKRLLIVPD